MFSPYIRTAVRLVNPVRSFVPQRYFRTLNLIDFPTTIPSDCTIDKDWLHQHFPTAVGVSLMDDAGNWKDVDILSGLKREVKKGTTVCITTDDGVHYPDIISTMSIVNSSGRAKRAFKQYRDSHSHRPLGIYYLVEITNTDTGAWCKVVKLVQPMLGASYMTLILKVQELISIEAGGYDNVMTTSGVVNMAAGLAQFRLLGCVLSSYAGGKTEVETLPKELKGLTVVNPVHLQGTRPLLGLQTLHDWGLSIDTVNRIIFIK